MNKMDECCAEFCRNLDEWIQDEENDERKYRSWADKARKNGQPYIFTILQMISKDEGKHAMALADVALMVCQEPNHPLTEKLKKDRGGFDFY